MSERDRSESQKAKNLAEIASRYLKGESQMAIATALKLNQSTVSRDLKELRSLWRSAAVRDFDEALAEQLAKIDLLEAEYWAAWGRSLTTRESLTNESGESDAKGAFTKTITRREVMLGNPAYLAGVERCIAERCKLLGLYAPAVKSATDIANQVISLGIAPEAFISELKKEWVAVDLGK